MINAQSATSAKRSWSSGTPGSPCRCSFRFWWNRGIIWISAVLRAGAPCSCAFWKTPGWVVTAPCSCSRCCAAPCRSTPCSWIICYHPCPHTILGHSINFIGDCQFWSDWAAYLMAMAANGFLSSVNSSVCVWCSFSTAGDTICPAICGRNPVRNLWSPWIFVLQ